MNQPEGSLQLSKNEVKRIALLCRIGLSESDIPQIQETLVNLLQEVRIIQAVDTEGIEPTGHAGEVDTVMREDEPAPSLNEVQVLANAPRTEGGYVRVQGIMEG